MLYEKWDIAGFDRDTAQKLCTDKDYPLNPLVAVLLTSRGYDNLPDIAAFTDAPAVPFHDPLLLTDMVNAVARIKKAISGNEYIAIYGDYDVDGMTSCAMLALWLESKGARFEIYIPGRFDEGYGLNTEALNTLKEHGVNLVITVDCGITAIFESQYAKEIGLDLIITDHHECKDELPEAAAVVNPKRADCKYPFSSLAGVGVVFKLICALEIDNTAAGDIFDRYGHLVALGTVADVMPVTGENRKMIIEGLKLLNDNPDPAIQSLLQESGTNDFNITAATISYMLAPRLNAAGRMGNPMLSVKLLLSRSSIEAKEYVTQLCQLNDTRRKLESDIFDAALTLLGGSKQTEPIVLAGTGWHQGVTGIVAAKMAERFKVPAVIISIDENGIGHGSCRSSGTFSIYNALCNHTDLLDNFGGHNMAAGITLKADNIGKLRERIAKHYKSEVSDASQAALAIDFEVEKPRLLSAENVEALCILEPFGRDNPTPRLCIRGATLTDIVSIGSGKHTKLKIEKSDDSAGGAKIRQFDCIFFSVAPQDLPASTGDTVDVAFEPQINEYRGRRNVQLHILDIKLSKQG